jgi:hypothetical protein
MTEIAERNVNTRVAVGDSKISFWADKQPCWEKCHCPEIIKAECPATQFQFVPCWQIEGTYCKLDDMGATGSDTTICEVCRVYKKYGKGEPIKIKVFGKGMDTQLREMEKITR